MINNDFDDVSSDNISARNYSTLEQSESALESPTQSVRRKPQVSNEERERIVAKTLEGHSVKEIADMYQLGYKTVYGLVQRFLTHGLLLPLNRGCDRRSFLTKEIKEPLLARVDQECTLTLRELSSWI